MYISSRVEIQNLIDNAKRLDADSLQVLKAISILNLVTTIGAMRATRTLVTLAMCDSPTDSNKSYWEQIIDRLLQKNIITHRRQLDELRIWQGSDFNVDSELANYIEKERSPLVKLLSTIRPLTPIVVATCNTNRSNLQSRHLQTRIICNYNWGSAGIPAIWDTL